MANQPSTTSGHQQQQQQPHTVVSISDQQAVPKIPCLDLLNGSREKYVDVAVPLYQAAMKGDWKAAKSILDKQPHLKGYAITENHETLLHIAASAESTKAVEKFVIKLVDMMDNKDLELQNKSGDTALSSAAAAGNIETAKIMVKKNEGLSEIPNKIRAMPLYMAALFAKPVMVRYLYGISNKMRGDFWKDENPGWVLQKCVEAEIFDVAIKIVEDRPELTKKKGLLTDVLVALAQKTQAFEGTKPNFVLRIINYIFGKFHVKSREKETEALQLLKIIWEKVARMPTEEIDEIIRGHPAKVENKNKENQWEALPILKMILEKIGNDKATPENKTEEKENENESYPSKVLFLAAKMGNKRFIIELIRLYPDIIWKQDDKKKTIFHLAVKRRQINIYMLLHELGAMKDLITPITDQKGNNMLHMVAKSAKQKRFQNVSGVAFQMQSELLWFKEVENMIPPDYRKRKNKDGKTPEDLFTKTHADLLKEGGEWMKNTASQCMVVATLIATIAFAAAFTLPGGYNQNGIPFFRNKPSLVIFVISDAVSLMCSTTSVLMFLSILTSRYGESDFLQALPRKLVWGIATLFFSIVTMMITFSASFFVLYHNKQKWMPITITVVASIPVIIYLYLQQDLFNDVYKAAFQSKHLFKRNNKGNLYY